MGTFTLTWEEAVRGFYTHKRVVKASSTAIWYLRYATQLQRWADSRKLSIDSFTNARLCKALLDRLTDRAHIIETGQESFCFRRTLERRNGVADTQALHNASGGAS